MLSLGIDIGSTTAKVVLMEGDRILYEKYERHFSQVRQKTLELLEELRPQLTGKAFTGAGKDRKEIPIPEDMKPQVEVKTRRVGGTTYPVPVPIAANRQLSLALRWTTQYASARHGMGMPAAVAAEVIDAFLGQGNVIKKRDDVHKMAQANKAFAHYAWGNNAG